MKIIIKQYSDSIAKTKSDIPITIEWNGQRMIRNHSIRAAVKDILTISESLDVVKINIIGNPGTGKTTLNLK